MESRRVHPVGVSTITVTGIVLDSPPTFHEKFVPSTRQVVSLAVARARHNRKKTSGQVEVIEVRLEAWGAVAEKMRMAHLIQGSVISVVGHLKHNDWYATDGHHYGPTTIGVDEFTVAQQ